MRIFFRKISNGSAKTYLIGIYFVAKNLAYNNFTIYNTAKNAICQYFKLVKV